MILKSVKVTQFAIVLTLMCLDANRNNGLLQLVTPERFLNKYNENLTF